MSTIVKRAIGIKIGSTELPIFIIFLALVVTLKSDVAAENSTSGHKYFRDAAEVTIVTPTPSIYRKIVSPKVSAYLFVPPGSEVSGKNVSDSSGSEVSAKNVSKGVTKVSPKSDVENFVTPPAAELALPVKQNGEFGKNGKSGATRETIQDDRRVSQKFAVPARSYGVPGSSYFPSTKVRQVETGEVLENSSGTDDCQGKRLIESDVEVTDNFGEKNPISPGYRDDYFPSTFGAAAAPPQSPPRSNFIFTPSPVYGPAGNNPGSPTGAGIAGPSDWTAGTNLGPVRIPNFPASGEYSQCCRSEYSAQRFQLASPGFPGLFTSGNPYECVYTIRPFSSNVCQIRFNFRYFNHGTDDNFCSNGHVEIEGHRYCGCKRGLSVVSPVLTTFPKVIVVKYTGSPRSKFAGFLMEVIQEPCSGSPFLSRRKKAVGGESKVNVPNVTSSRSSSNFTATRTKRNLGYSYPKPNFGFIEGDSTSGNAGIHQLLNPGVQVGNLFAPIDSCQALSFFDWVNAAKDVYLRGARCVRSGSNVGGSGWIAGYPGTGGSGWIAGYPGTGGSGLIPGYPGGSGNWYPGNWNPGTGGSGSWNPGTGGSGSWNPGTGGSASWNPGTGGSGSWHPGTGGSGSWNLGTGGSGNWNPGTGGSGNSYPGAGGSGSWNSGNGGSGNWYPGTGGSGTIIPGYPGTGGSGTIIPGYPGTGGSAPLPGYPGTESGTINPGSGSWNVPSSKCEDVNVVEGIISSPQYPTNYPNNVNKCFRFYRAPEFCQLELVFLDFDLENSTGCAKDYITINGQNRRFCGRSLAGSSSLIDISRTNILDIHFVSDGYGSARGFSAGFSQIPCRQISR